MEADGGGHELEAQVRNSPSSGAGHLAQQATQVQALELAPDACSEGARPGRAGRSREEALAHVAVVEALDNVLALHDGGEELHVGAGDWD